MVRRVRTTGLGLLLALAIFGSSDARGQSAPPTRVILLIGDGTGTGQWTTATNVADHLSVSEMPVGGLIDTRSTSHRVTDSAAGATAYSAGIRTYNGAIAVGPDSVPVPTVLEMARDRGMATGLVSTSSITHATPAAFASHVPDRQMQNEIALQFVTSGVTVFLGGGSQWFDPAVRDDSLDLLSRLEEDYTMIHNAAELRALGTDSVTSLFGVFAPDGMQRATARQISLSEMTTAALAVLDHDPDGFFLMVEGSQIDWRSHDRDPIEAVRAEVLDFDRAIGIALAFQIRHPGTLVVVTADHETGGLSVVETEEGDLVAVYGAAHHTANLIPLFASGEGADVFGGIHDNFEIGLMLIDLVKGR